MDSKLSVGIALGATGVLFAVVAYAVLAHANPLVPAVNTDMNCPTISGGIPDVIGSQDGLTMSCFVAPTSVGPQGPAGATGSQGATGAQGPAGATGATGATGPAGATGAAGPSALTGITGSIGGGLLSVGSCATGTATVTGATVGMVAMANPATYQGDGVQFQAYVSAANTVTVKACALLLITPTATTYNVRVIQ